MREIQRTALYCLEPFRNVCESVCVKLQLKEEPTSITSFKVFIIAKYGKQLDWGTIHDLYCWSPSLNLRTLNFFFFLSCHKVRGEG